MPEIHSGDDDKSDFSAQNESGWVDNSEIGSADEDNFELELARTESKSSVESTWYASVQDYSQRTLSYPNDILVALGGLA